MTRIVNLDLRKSWCFDPADFEWVLKRWPRNIPIDPKLPPKTLAFFDEVYSNCNLNADKTTEYLDCIIYLKERGYRQASRYQSRFISQEDNTAWRGFYQFRSFCTYTTKDCAKCELVSFSLDCDLSEGCGEEGDRTPYIDMGDLANEGGEDNYYDFMDGKLRIFDLLHNRIGVSDEGKRLLEASELTGFSITRRLRVTGDRSDEVQGNYWLVDVPLVLPLSGKTCWERLNGEIFTGPGEPDAALHDEDNLFSFDRAVIQEVGAFDLASWQPGDALPRKLGTNRWFKFCKENKIKCNWTPVKVVD